jgi:hypothetical protein
VYDVKGVQEGFNSMLRHNSFLRRARPMTFEVPGQRSELGPQTAVWSGMIAADKALVRTVSFDHGRSVSRAVTVYDRPIRLVFGARGQDYWVYPSGKVEAVE